MTKSEQDRAEQLIRELTGLPEDAQLAPRTYIKYTLQHLNGDGDDLGAYPFEEGSREDTLVNDYVRHHHLAWS